MRTPLFFTGSASSNVSNSADRYAPIAGTGMNSLSYGTLGAGGIIGNATQVALAGTISALRMRFPTVLTQGTFTVTLYKGTTQSNMVATALTATVGTASTDAVDLAHSVTVAAGDYVAWRVQPSGTPTAQTGSVQISTLFEATTAGRQPLFTYFAGGTIANFAPPGCGGGGTEAVSTVVAPTAFTVRRMYVSLSAASGAAPGTGNSRTITLRKGTAAGGLSDTTLTVTFGATDIEKTIDLGGSPLSVAAGDFLSIGQTITGTPNSSPVKLCMEIEPAVSGQSIRFATVAGLSATAARYASLAGTSPTTETTEANVGQLAPTQLTVKALRVDTTTAPGTSKTRTVTLRAGPAPADTALAVALTGGAITASASTDVIVPAGQTLDFSHVPASSPASSAWTTVSTVIVAAANSGVSFAPSDRNEDVFEGISNTSKVIVGGAYSGTPTDVQVALWSAATGGTNVSGWVSATTQAGGVYGHTFSGTAVGGPYYVGVRDNGGTETRGTAALYVGAIFNFLADQSQVSKLFSDDVSGLTPSSGMNIRVLTPSSITNVATASTTITRLSPATIGIAGVTGSGIVAVANRLHALVGAGTPIMLVMASYPGTSLDQWLTDRKGDYDYSNPGSPGTDPTSLWGTSPTTGLAWFMAAATHYQMTASVFMRGTADVSTYSTRSANLDAFKTKMEGLYTGVAVAPLIVMFPHQRSDDGPNTWTLRDIDTTKAKSGSTWRFAGHLLDWQMDGDGSPHELSGATGSYRGGTFIAQGIHKTIFDNTTDVAGPQPVSLVFNATRTYFDVTYDRDIETTSGATTGIAGVFVSTNGGTTWPTAPASITWTAAIQSARVLRVATTGSPFPSGTTRFDTHRGIPYASDLAASDYAGTEANFEANYAAKSIRDTTSYDGGRGMLAGPAMGAGWGVDLAPVQGAAAGTITLFGSATGVEATGGTGSATITLFGSSIGYEGTVGTSAATLSLIGSAIGSESTASTSGATLVLSGSGAGVHTAPGAAGGPASATIALFATATGSHGIGGLASASISLFGGSTGIYAIGGTAGGILAFQAAAGGTFGGEGEVGTAAGSVNFIASASGSTFPPPDPAAIAFRAAFPTFAAVPDDTILFWLARAARVVDDSWTEGDRVFGRQLLAAHLMTEQGLGTGAEAAAAAAGASGFRVMRSGSLSLERSTGAATEGYGTTAYGRQFVFLLQQNRGGARMTGTGCIVDGGYDYGVGRVPGW